MKNSPYLDPPFVPLAVALPIMMATIEARLTTARPEEKQRLENRAELVRSLLASGRNVARDF